MKTQHHPLFDGHLFISTSESNTLKRLNRSPLTISPFIGIFACNHCWNRTNPVERNRQFLQAVAEKRPSWVLCATSAATILGINSSYRLQNNIHISVHKGSFTQRSQHVVQHFLTARRPDDITRLGKVLITSPCRTIFDCARLLPFEESLPIIDSALRQELVTHTQLLNYCHVMKNFHGRKKAENAISYGSKLSENGGESLARAQMILLGYVPPQQQVWFEDSVSKRNYRVDFLWRDGSGETIIAEFHGKQKYIDPEMMQGRSLNDILSAEEKRESRLSLYKIRIINLDYKDVQSLESLARELKPYNIPRRPHAKVGQLEFNPYLALSESLAASQR